MIWHGCRTAYRPARNSVASKSCDGQSSDGLLNLSAVLSILNRRHNRALRTIVQFQISCVIVMADSFSMQMVRDVFHFGIPACPAIAALAFLFRCDASAALVPLVMVHRASRRPCLSRRTVNHGCANADNQIARNDSAGFLKSFDNGQFPCWQPMFNPRRLPRDFADLFQMFRRLQIAGIVPPMPPALYRAVAALASDFMHVPQHHDHCANPCRTSQAGESRFMRLRNGRIKIVCFERIAPVANATFNLRKLGSSDASFCADTVCRSRHFRRVT